MADSFYRLTELGYADGVGWGNLPRGYYKGSNVEPGVYRNKDNDDIVYDAFKPGDIVRVDAVQAFQFETWAKAPNPKWERVNGFTPDARVQQSTALETLMYEAELDTLVDRAFSS